MSTTTLPAPFQIVGRNGLPLLTVTEDPKGGVAFALHGPDGVSVSLWAGRDGAGTEFRTAGLSTEPKGGHYYLQVGRGTKRTTLQLSRGEHHAVLEVGDGSSELELSSVTREGDRLSEAKLIANQDGAGLELSHPETPAGDLTDEERDDLNREPTLTVWASEGVARTELPAA